MKATLSYLNSATLPAHGHLRVGSVVRGDIARFFYEYGRRKQGGANRSHEILRNMFDCAMAWGHRSEAAGNPWKGIVRYRRPPRGRLLGAHDLAKLGAAARELLDSLGESTFGEWVFPSNRRDGPLTKNLLYWFWTTTRDAAGIAADARQHELRHTRVSHAVMNGERLHVARRLLGHRLASMTNRYVHLNDATLSDAAERVCFGGATETALAERIW